VSETCMAEFDNLMSVNVKGTMLCVRALSRAMKNQEERLVASRTGPCSVGRGSIVNLASANSVVAFPEIVQYTAAKHAVLGITKTAGANSSDPKTVMHANQRKLWTMPLTVSGSMQFVRRGWKPR
jgi:NAD(P)-dependent dehydrogenase (short-subunit alcohol dehydrogenase family)